MGAPPQQITPPTFPENRLVAVRCSPARTGKDVTVGARSCTQDGVDSTYLEKIQLPGETRLSAEIQISCDRNGLDLKVRIFFLCEVLRNLGKV